MAIDYSKFDAIDDDDDDFQRLLEGFEDEMGLGLGHDLGYDMDPGLEDSERLDFEELQKQERA